MGDSEPTKKRKASASSLGENLSKREKRDFTETDLTKVFLFFFFFSFSFLLPVLSFLLFILDPPFKMSITFLPSPAEGR